MQNIYTHKNHTHKPTNKKHMVYNMLISMKKAFYWHIQNIAPI